MILPDAVSSFQGSCSNISVELAEAPNNQKLWRIPLILPWQIPLNYYPVSGRKSSIDVLLNKKSSLPESSEPKQMRIRKNRSGDFSVLTRCSFVFRQYRRYGREDRPQCLEERWD